MKEHVLPQAYFESSVPMREQIEDDRRLAVQGLVLGGAIILGILGLSFGYGDPHDAYPNPVPTTEAPANSPSTTGVPAQGSLLKN